MSLAERLAAFRAAWPAARRAAEVEGYQRLLDQKAPTSGAQQAMDALVMGAFSSDDRDHLDSLPTAELRRDARIVWRLWLDATVRTRGGLGPSIDAIASRVWSRKIAVGGQTLDLAQLMGWLRQSDDAAAREDAWRRFFARDVQLEENLVALVEARNAQARALGFADFYALRLEADDLTRRDLDRASRRILDALSLDASVAAFREASDLDTWTPWDAPRARAQAAGEAPGDWPAERMIDACRRFLEGHGHLWPPGLRIETATVAIGGALHLIDIPHDLRMVVHPTGGWQSWERFVHELGHAQHFAHITEPDALLQDESSGGMVEAYAQVFAAMTRTPAFLVEVGGLNPATAEHVAARLADAERWAQRVTVALTRFEERLYGGHPPDEAYITAMREALGYDDQVSSAWMWDPMLATHPVYYQDYVMADVLADGMLAEAAARFGSVLDPAVAPWLRTSFFAPGRTRSWRAKVRAHLPDLDL